MAETNETASIEQAVGQLGLSGFAVSTGILLPDLVRRLIAEQRRREDGGELVEAGLGRGSGQTGGGIERQAQSSWFTGQSAAECDFLAFAERVRQTINRRLMLGLFEFEAQFLHYPPGGYYRRHLDALHGTRSRVVSLIAYLNQDWTIEDGGALAIWNASGQGDPVAEIVPQAGTVVLMLSEEIPHEARTARRDRRAIAGWFRVNPSSDLRVDLAR